MCLSNSISYRFMFVTVIALAILVARRFHGLARCESKDRKDLLDEYDFVIVGGGKSRRSNFVYIYIFTNATYVSQVLLVLRWQVRLQ